MFSISEKTVRNILSDFGINGDVIRVAELQRYDYENDSANHVRLIVKAELADAMNAFVLRFVSEDGVTRELIEDQCRFADIMRQNGVATPKRYRAGGSFTEQYAADGYDVTVTVEDFAENEIKLVDEDIAEKTGHLLAEMHNISETLDLHVKNRVLFDPLDKNDLFDAAEFLCYGASLDGEEKAIFDEIVSMYEYHMRMLSPLGTRRRYAVQGDLSDCNMYTTADGSVGVFDYNNCGDNELFCDAVMEGVFVSRLMDYPEGAGAGYDERLLSSFLRGYRTARDFTDEERELYPHLYAVINAFWWSDNVDALADAVKNCNRSGTREGLERVLVRISDMRTA